MVNDGGENTQLLLLKQSTQSLKASDLDVLESLIGREIWGAGGESGTTRQLRYHRITIGKEHPIAIVKISQISESYPLLAGGKFMLVFDKN